MIEYQILDPEVSVHFFTQIKKRNKSTEYFSGFKSFNKKLYKSDFKILNDNFDCQNIIFFSLSHLPIAACTHYKPKNHLQAAGYPESVGNLLFFDQITDQQLKDCGQILKKYFFESEVVLPLNGSFNLGIYHNPNPIGKTSFLTTAYNSEINRFFEVNKDIFLKHRTSHALKLNLNRDVVAKLKAELAIDKLENEFSTRSFSRYHFIKDFKKYNQLVNASMADHFLFFPVRWQAMKQLVLPLVLFIVPQFFRFILKDKVEIGFVLAIPDYNEVLMNSRSDFMNGLKCITDYRKIKQARVVYSCLLPKYQGKKLIKVARHQVLIDLFDRGFTSVESSYIDENNLKSLRNARSTGAQPVRDYFLYKT